MSNKEIFNQWWRKQNYPPSTKKAWYREWLREMRKG
jgi:hypothetical protein